MFRLMHSRKGQAVTELAVLGTLVIVAFSYLMSWSEEYNRQQSYLMQTFRRALQEAKTNTSAQVTNLAFRRTANIISPYTLGNLSTFSSSAAVVWLNDNDNSDGTIIRKINEGFEQNIDPDSLPDDDPNAVQNSTYNSESKVGPSISTFTKRETPGGARISTRNLTAKDELKVKMTSTAMPTLHWKTFYLGPDGKYYYNERSSQMERGKEWRTRD